MSDVRYLIGDVRARLADIPDGSIDLVLTSWPYWLQRAYLPDDHPDKAFEIGQEPTVAGYLATLLDVTAELGRVLAPHGSIALELADTFSGSGGAGGDYNEGGLRDGQPRFDGSAVKSRHGADMRPGKRPDARRQPEHDGGAIRDRRKHDGAPGVIPPDKSLCMVPELFRVALAYGIHPLTGVESPAGMWRCRNVVLHCRPNPPVGDDGDKFRPGKSDWVIACRERTRWWDGFAVRVPASENTNARTAKSVAIADRTSPKGWADEDHRSTLRDMHSTGDTAPLLDHWWDDDPRLDRFDREAWHLSTAPYKGAHFATFSPKLIAPMILAMCPERVCTTCGEPSRRIVRKHSTSQNTVKHRAHEGDARQVGAVTSTEVPDAAQIEHVGWTDCGHASWRRGVVLDPFGGSGTAGMVAAGLGRDAILIDVDDRNLDLARARIGMFLTIDDEVVA